MSFLAGRLAGKEGAYFLQESKQAVTRLVQKSPTPTSTKTAHPPYLKEADILSEVLKHSLPSKVFQQTYNLDSPSLKQKSKWVIHSDHKKNLNGSHVSPDVINPLRAYVSLPQVTFGPRRWELPNAGHVSASTANELRRDRYTPINPEKLKAAAEGISEIGKAFAVATAIVFGGATLLFSLAVSKLEMHNSDDIRMKGQDLVKPKFDMVREQLMPIRTWAENKSKRWHLERENNIREKPIIKELSKILGAKTSG